MIKYLILILFLFTGCVYKGELNYRLGCHYLKNVNKSKIYSITVGYYNENQSLYKTEVITLKAGEQVKLECDSEEVRIEGSTKIAPINYEQHKNMDSEPYRTSKSSKKRRKRNS